MVLCGMDRSFEVTGGNPAAGLKRAMAGAREMGGAARLRAARQALLVGFEPGCGFRLDLGAVEVVGGSDVGVVKEGGHVHLLRHGT